jgi:nucleoside-diphosphate-sugar epimerase
MITSPGTLRLTSPASLDHDFTHFGENCEKDQRNIDAMGEALAGSKRPFVITSGIGLGSKKPGELATEDVFNDANPHPRKMSELAGNALLDRGLNISYVRLPQVHDTRKQGLVTNLVAIAREKKRVAYLDDGTARFAAAHVSDVARLYKLVVERDEPGARYHAIAEEGVSRKDIAEAIGRALQLPVASVTGNEATAYFGRMMMFAGVDSAGSSVITRKKLGWEPAGPGLIHDLERLDA